MSAPKKYDQETQARAVRMYADRIAEGDISQRGAREEVGELLDINPATLRNWIRRDLGEGVTPAVGEPGDEEAEQRGGRATRVSVCLLRGGPPPVRPPAPSDAELRRHYCPR